MDKMGLVIALLEKRRADDANKVAFTKAINFVKKCELPFAELAQRNFLYYRSQRRIGPTTARILEKAVWDVYNHGEKAKP